MKRAHPAASIAIAACVAEISAQAPAEILLIPAGEFRARDGRPQGLSAWRMDERAALRIVTQAAAAAGDFVIDYEHQTLHSQDNGRPAPAAGWFKRLEWRAGQGLYATDVRWTEAARAAIAALEYRYISPVFTFAPRTGEVLAVQMAALTNFPAIDGHSDLAVRAAASFHIQYEEDTQVDRTQLITLLGLADDATDAQITEALEALKAKAAKADGLTNEVAALKAQTPDPAKFAPVQAVQALQAEVAALRASQHAREVEELIAPALADGRLLPAMEAWARDLGKSDVAALKGYLEKAQPIAALKRSQTGGKQPDGTPSGGELDEAALAVCRQMGISPEAYKKTLAANG